MDEPIFGDLPGYPPGTAFASRLELSSAGLHRPTMAGIWGKADRGGAQSIVLSGGYEDDEDLGEVIIYTGQGGRTGGVQTADQELTLGNHALYRSRLTGLPVRVIRGEGHRSPFSPKKGYRYDGTYRVVDSWTENGKSGFRVWRFRLERFGRENATQDPGLEVGASAAPDVLGSQDPARRGSWVVRTVRDTAVSRRVKALHEYKCQVCGLALETSGGLYAEAAHIQPLGRPHNGPDVPENCLCLCPNHHVLFDQGAFSVHPESFALVGLNGALRLASGHSPGRQYLAYHHSHYRQQGGKK